MKKIFFTYLILKITLFFALAQSYEIYNGDTINRIDQNGLRQGKWIFFNEKYKNGIAAIGYYKDNKKQGVWQTFYPNGNLKSIITYNDNKLDGIVKFYYENGNVKEEGYWKLNHWVGDYKYYYPNGKLKYHFFFSEDGKRNGTQIYFYENGKKFIEGNWLAGKKSGQLKEYYKNGNIKRISNWLNGKLNGEVIEYYADGNIKMKTFYVNGIEQTNKRIVYNKPENIQYQDTVVVENQENKKQKVPVQLFTGTGEYKLYNLKGMLVLEGYFRQGKLINGKRYIYNQNDELIKTQIIQNGKVVREIRNK